MLDNCALWAAFNFTLAPQYLSTSVPKYLYFSKR
jgi:hypothetical protein